MNNWFYSEFSGRYLASNSVDVAAFYDEAAAQEYCDFKNRPAVGDKKETYEWIAKAAKIVNEYVRLPVTLEPVGFKISGEAMKDRPSTYSIVKANGKWLVAVSDAHGWTPNYLTRDLKFNSHGDDTATFDTPEQALEFWRASMAPRHHEAHIKQAEENPRLAAIIAEELSKES